MIKVFLTKGLPGSGKSTWAKNVIANNPNSYKRINKDDLRAMLDNGKHSNDSEKFILKVRDLIIMEAVGQGKHVIVDDTNFSPKHEKRILELVKGKAELIIQDFTNVPLEICIKRDLERAVSVGEKVIRQMYNQYLNKPEVYTEDSKLPKAIIVDIDGTLAKMNGRSPFDWDKVREDTCNKVIKDIVNSYEYNVFIFSGRDGVCRNNTIKWLYDNGIIYKELFMREVNDSRKDSIIKRELFEKNIRGKYFVEYVLDDRNQVVEMWRSIGLTCLQVADGDF